MVSDHLIQGCETLVENNITKYHDYVKHLEVLRQNFIRRNNEYKYLKSWLDTAYEDIITMNSKHDNLTKIYKALWRNNLVEKFLECRNDRESLLLKFVEVRNQCEDLKRNLGSVTEEIALIKSEYTDYLFESGNSIWQNILSQKHLECQTTKKQETLRLKFMEIGNECERLSKCLNEVHERIVSLESEHEDLIRRYRVFTENSKVKEFLDYAKYLESLQMELMERTQTCRGSESCINHTNKKNIESLNVQLTETKNILNNERIQNEKMEAERNTLDFLSGKLCGLLFKYQCRALPEEMKKTYLAVNESIENSIISDDTLFSDSNSNFDESDSFDSSEIVVPECSIDVEKMSFENDAECELQALNLNQDEQSVDVNKETNSSPVTLTVSENKSLDSLNPCCNTDNRVEEKSDAVVTNEEPDSLVQHESPSTSSHLTIPESQSEIPTEALRYFDCDSCGESFSTKRSITEHVKTHLENSCGNIVQKPQSIVVNKKTNWFPIVLIARVDNSLNSSEPCCSIDNQLAEKSDAVVISKEHDSLEQRKSLSLRCDLCLRDHSDIHELNQHKCIPRKELKTKRLKCSSCDKTYADKNSMKIHATKDHGADGAHYDCAYCNRRFYAKYPLVRHISVRHSSELKPCECTQKCKCLKPCIGRPRFKCSLCDNTYAYKHAVQRHASVAHGSGRPEFKCSLCDKTYVYKYAVQRHASVAHKAGGSGRPTFKCSLCDKTYAYKYTVQRHASVAHEANIQYYDCAYCNKRFYSKFNLARHIQVHFSSKPSISRLDRANKNIQSLHLQPTEAEKKSNNGRLGNGKMENELNTRGSSFKHQSRALPEETIGDSLETDELIDDSVIGDDAIFSDSDTNHNKANSSSGSEIRISEFKITLKRIHLDDADREFQPLNSSEDEPDPGIVDDEDDVASVTLSAPVDESLDSSNSNSKSSGETSQLELSHREISKSQSETTTETRKISDGDSCGEVSSTRRNITKNVETHLSSSENVLQKPQSVIVNKETNWSPIVLITRLDKSLNSLNSCCNNDSRFGEKNDTVVNNEESGSLVPHKSSSTSSRLESCKRTIPKSQCESTTQARRIFDCDSCGESFSTRQSIIKHMETHSRSSYRCGKCQKFFTAENNPQKSVKCPACDAVIENPSESSEKTDSAATGEKQDSLVQNKNSGTTNRLKLRNRAIQKSQSRMITVDQPPFECDSCGRSFPTKSSIAMHVGTHLRSRLYRCEKCQKSFTAENSLRGHPKCPSCNTVCETLDLSCNICGQRFAGKNLLDRHKTYVHGRKKGFECSTCGKRFARNDSLTEHKFVHNTARIFKCSVCGLDFTSHIYLKKHKKRQHGRHEPYKCAICDKSFSRKDYLKIHAAIHGSLKAFKCSFCDRNFKLKYEMQVHVKKIHKGDIRPHRFCCAHCDKRYIQKSALSEHLNSKHFSGSLDIKKYPCNKCDKSFYHPISLKIHQIAHTTKRPYKCSICGNSFKRRHSRERHEKKYHAVGVHCRAKLKCSICAIPFSSKRRLRNHVLLKHPSEKPNKCSFCKKTFKLLSVKRFHERTVHKNEAHVFCAYCDKGLLSKNSLIRHIQVMHLPEFKAEFKCTICDKVFSREDQLKAHKSVHTSKGRFKCSVCDKRFHRRSERANHEQKAYGKEIPRYFCAHCDVHYLQKRAIIRHLQARHSRLFK